VHLSGHAALRQVVEQSTDRRPNRRIFLEFHMQPALVIDTTDDERHRHRHTLERYRAGVTDPE
jgi:hypothetical protein